MANVTYVALRDVMSGHTAGVSYGIDFSPAAAVRVPRSIKKESRSLSGKTQTTIYTIDELWDLQTSFVLASSTTYDQWLEFFGSVRGGETFTIDIKGTNASPVNPITVVMQGDETENRNDHRIDGYVSFSFKVLYNANL